MKSSSGESLPAGTVGSHPYKIPQPPMQQMSVKYPDDFPLRKTGEFSVEKSFVVQFCWLILHGKFNQKAFVQFESF